ncbi:hypothetical protein BGX23_009656 [Mortierella sp. AD031]|nr:hypothetical protein BGX23_009656 [Mortierella sp. AD031]
MSIPSSKPNVLIVGAGFGGLVLGALLEKASIPYVILERASGYYSYIIGRPALYDLLLKLIPPHKILFGKRVLSTSEDVERVKVQTADSCVYEGDILVGADGAYSAVRQRLYERLKKEGNLPLPDQEDLPFKSTCLVGQTKALNPADFPEFKGTSHIITLGNDKPFTWMAVPTAQNTFCWMVMHHLDKASSKEAEGHRFRDSQNSEWGPHAAETMCDETRDFPVELGGKKMTMGDIYDWTPKDLTSKVMLEEKVFQTWHSGRTVLLGDACHKVNPMGGQGAIIAMHGALALANLLYALPSNTTADIEEAFEAYKAERMGPSTEAFRSSQLFSKFLEKGYVGPLLLFLMRYSPAWAFNFASRRIVMNRPTAGFLAKIESKGTVPAEVSPSTEKARKVFERSAHLIGPSLMPLFAQLGIKEEFIALGKRALNSTVIKENEGPVLTVDYQTQEEYSRYYSYII